LGSAQKEVRMCTILPPRGSLASMNPLIRILTAPAHLAGRILTGIGRRLTGRS
jgi:hypothetical protein